MTHGAVPVTEQAHPKSRILEKHRTNGNGRGGTATILPLAFYVVCILGSKTQEEMVTRAGEIKTFTDNHSAR